MRRLQRGLVLGIAFVCCLLFAAEGSYLRNKKNNNNIVISNSKSSASQQKYKHLLTRYLQSKAKRINQSFAEQLSAGVTYNTQIGENITDEVLGDCSVSGSATYSLSKVTGLNATSSASPYGGVRSTTSTNTPINSYGSSAAIVAAAASKASTHLEQLEGQDGLWSMRTTIEPFRAHLVAQVLGSFCGKPMDFTSFGHVKVDGAMVNATIRVDGSAKRPQVVDITDLKPHHVELESSLSFGKLVKKIPQKTIDSTMNDFLHSLFTAKFQKIMEGELRNSS